MLATHRRLVENRRMPRPWGGPVRDMLHEDIVRIRAETGVTTFEAVLTVYKGKGNRHRYKICLTALDVVESPSDTGAQAMAEASV